MNLKSLARKAASAYRRSHSAPGRAAPAARRGPAGRGASPKARAVRQVSRLLRKR
jgi:hypothetical protein